MEFDIPSEFLKLRWTSAGEVMCKVDKYRSSLAAPTAVASASTASLGGSHSLSASTANNAALSDRIAAVRASIAGIRRWSSQHNTQQEAAVMQFNMEQTERRSALGKDEAKEWRELVSMHVVGSAAAKAISALTTSESEARKAVVVEAADFMAFATSKEPLWRKMAQDKSDARLFTSSALEDKASLISQGFSDYTNTLFAIQIQESEDRDMAFALQLQREEQANEARFARQCEQDRLAALAAQREQDELSRRQQQQQQNNFAMPPSNIYGGGQGYGGGYSYNYGPASGATYTGQQRY